MVDFAGRQVHAEDFLAIDVDNDTVVAEHFSEQIGEVGGAWDVEL